MGQRQFRSDDTSPWPNGFGNGSDGALVISGNVTDSTPNTSITGTSGSQSAAVGSGAGFVSGNLVLIHQSRNGGDGTGNWELNKIQSVGDGTNWTLAYPLTHNYDTTAQVYLLKQYSSVTINGGVTLTGSNWNGSTGGIIAFLCSGTISIAGTINVNGNNGNINSSNQHQTPGGYGIGYKGGDGLDNQQAAYYAEGTGGGAAQCSNSNPNGSGGGGGKGNGNSNNGGGGGGGGNAGSGGNGKTAGAGGAWAGSGGSSAGSTDLTNMVFGGGGGGSGDGPQVGGGDYGSGAAGAGIVLLIGQTINITGSVTSNGGAGGSIYRSGGGGAGGSILFKGQTITLGTNLITANWGQGGGNGSGVAGGSSPGDGGGGNGAWGRIHADYKTSISGATTPSIDMRQDLSLNPPSIGGAFLNTL